jgi:hypothetical protein
LDFPERHFGQGNKAFSVIEPLPFGLPNREVILADTRKEKQAIMARAIKRMRREERKT